MKCLRKYKWVKLPRKEMPELKGRLGYWLKLAESAAFCKGIGTYCGHKNPVEPGMWAGGIVGLKAILGVKSRAEAFRILDHLETLGYLTYTLDRETKLLTYRITDWVMECTGEECMDGAVYATPGHGFICMPRDITERLAEKNYEFDEADAWLDLWCHTVFRDYGNAFSFLSPVIQYGKYGSMLTLETLGNRWGWEKTKVWRFFRKYATSFQLYRLPNSYGCVIYSQFYPTCDKIQMPEKEAVLSIFREILIRAQNTHTSTAPDPSEDSTEGNEPAGSVGETDSAETQSPQQATEKPTTPTASLEETKPIPTTPPETTPTRPTEQETEEMDQTKEIVDASQISAQANSYAVSLGFVVDNSLNKSNSGYYCPDYRPISTNEIGTAAAKDLVSATKNQLNSRFSESYSPTLIESIFGLVRVNCAVEYSHTDDMGDWYYIYVFYG